MPRFALQADGLRSNFQDLPSVTVKNPCLGTPENCHQLEMMMVMVKTGRPITHLSFQHSYGMFFSSAHTCPDFFMFQDNSVVNETNIF